MKHYTDNDVTELVKNCMDEALDSYRTALKKKIEEEIKEDDGDPFYNGLRKALQLIDSTTI